MLILKQVFHGAKQTKGSIGTRPTMTANNDKQDDKFTFLYITVEVLSKRNITNLERNQRPGLDDTKGCCCTNARNLRRLPLKSSILN